MTEQEQQEDQYMTAGAPNFDSALGVAAALYGNLSEEAQAEVILIVVDRYGACTVIGQGENLPSNEEGPQSGGFIVYSDDIANFLDNDDSGDESDSEEDEDGEDDEEEEEAEEGDDDTPPAPKKTVSLL